MIYWQQIILVYVFMRSVFCINSKDIGITLLQCFIKKTHIMAILGIKYIYA